MPSGIDVILQDHALVRDRFDQFEANPRGRLAGQIFGMSVVHDEVEHAALYPLSAVLLNAPGRRGACRRRGEGPLPALAKKATEEQLELLATRISQNKQRVG